MVLFLRSLLLLLPLLAFGELQDEHVLMQGTLHLGKLRDQQAVSRHEDTETDEDKDDEGTEATAATAATASTAGTASSAGTATTAKVEESQTAEAAANKAGELDMMARSLTNAKKTLQQARKTVAEARRRVRVLVEENVTAWSKWERSHRKKEEWAAKAFSTRLKQKERAGLKGKHVHLDLKAYGERIKSGNLSSYGLWTTSNEKQHFGEKTWDILSNHIFGLDKLMKAINNASEYEQNAAKYRAYEKYFSAKAAAAQQELAELNATIEKAEMDASEARDAIASLTAKRTETQATVRQARRQLAKAKADRKRDNQNEAGQSEDGDADDADEQADESEEEEADKEDAEEQSTEEEPTEEQSAEEEPAESEATEAEELGEREPGTEEKSGVDEIPEP